MYVEAVVAHSQQGTEATLYPGFHYERLASYLQRHLAKTRDAETNFPRAQPTFAFLYTNVESNTGEVTQIEHSRQFLDHLNQQLEETRGSILFLRGQPSADLLANIGAVYRIDPEYFLRHLEVISTLGLTNSFSTPTLPSSFGNFIQLRYITIGRSSALGPKIDPQSIDTLRANACKEQNAYVGRLARDIEADLGVGNSITRDFHIFEDGHFALEKEISLYIARIEGSWMGKTLHLHHLRS